MKAQTEIIVFVLLFAIGIVLLTTAVLWSRGVLEQNTDLIKVRNSEDFMIELDQRITNLIKNGGSERINYPLTGTIQLVGSDTIEVRDTVNIELPTTWVNITRGASYIREIKEGNTLRIQLIYPEGGYKVQLFTEGPTLARPARVAIEKNDTLVSNNVQLIKIKITFL